MARSYKYDPDEDEDTVPVRDADRRAARANKRSRLEEEREGVEQKEIRRGPGRSK